MTERTARGMNRVVTVAELDEIMRGLDGLRLSPQQNRLAHCLAGQTSPVHYFALVTELDVSRECLQMHLLKLRGKLTAVGMTTEYQNGRVMERGYRLVWSETES